MLEGKEDVVDNSRANRPWKTRHLAPASETGTALAGMHNFATRELTLICYELVSKSSKRLDDIRTKNFCFGPIRLN